MNGHIAERVNSGEQPHGLNLIIHDSVLVPNLFFAASITHKQSPQNTTQSYMFSTTTLVLSPQ